MQLPLRATQRRRCTTPCLPLTIIGSVHRARVRRGGRDLRSRPIQRGVGGALREGLSPSVEAPLLPPPPQPSITLYNSLHRVQGRSGSGGITAAANAAAVRQPVRARVAVITVRSRRVNASRPVKKPFRQRRKNACDPHLFDIAVGPTRRRERTAGAPPSILSAVVAVVGSFEDRRLGNALPVSHTADERRAQYAGRPGPRRAGSGTASPPYCTA